ncbi:hypothetical protein RNAN_0970 [Rheinheimera nanhaiensis E407-8]|uniref:Uncharacterized protein n=1 Tax=Rheinheimera nanhaiensis E407-8 TaxID=562729 RepID=I1DVC1_9GAMM|nr:hypothetical protein [Rheinheimera nanhaiensis]GAB57999.1 hypothetical protein RNAN_0970 [Rheinheimera nanhaiensis E407-8]
MPEGFRLLHAGWALPNLLLAGDTTPEQFLTHQALMQGTEN